MDTAEGPLGATRHVDECGLGFKPIASGAPDRIRKDPDVIKAYLGGAEDAADDKAA